MLLRSIVVVAAILFAGSADAAVFRYDFAVDFMGPDEPNGVGNPNMPHRTIAASFTVDNDRAAAGAPDAVLDVSITDQFLGDFVGTGTALITPDPDLSFPLFHMELSSTYGAMEFNALTFVTAEGFIPVGNDIVPDINSPVSGLVDEAWYVSLGDPSVNDRSRSFWSISITEVALPIPLPASLGMLLLAMTGLFGAGFLRSAAGTRSGAT